MNSFSEQASYLSVAKSKPQREQAKSNDSSAQKKMQAPHSQGSAAKSPEARVPPTVPTKQKTPPMEPPGTPKQDAFTTPPNSRERRARALTSALSPPKTLNLSDESVLREAIKENKKGGQAAISPKAKPGSASNPIVVAEAETAQAPIVIQSDEDTADMGPNLQPPQDAEGEMDQLIKKN